MAPYKIGDSVLLLIMVGRDRESLREPLTHGIPESQRLRGEGLSDFPPYGAVEGDEHGESRRSETVAFRFGDGEGEDDPVLVPDGRRVVSGCDTEDTVTGLPCLELLTKEECRVLRCVVVVAGLLTEMTVRRRVVVP